MKTIIFIGFCIVSVAVYGQVAQKINTFCVVDESTKKPIPYTSVSFLAGKQAISTENNGIFHIPGNLLAMSDTIVFYAQNYVTLTLPLKTLASMQTIPLTRLALKKMDVPNNPTEEISLNDYQSIDIGLYSGAASENAPFNYLQIAEQFSIDDTGSRLTSIIIHKQIEWMSTKFRIRIYDIDLASGHPGADLCDKIIDQDNENDVLDVVNKTSDFKFAVRSREVKIDLRKYNIVIPNKVFFVAVEWLRDFYNAVKIPVYNKYSHRTDTVIGFRPFIGISPTAGPQLNIWVMEFNHKWKTYNHFFPFGTDLSIQAKVEHSKAK